jgi:type III restriction enzyme
MKFSFKIQLYQTDAVDAVARVFQGQPYNAGVSYLRDMGSLSAQPQQLSLVSNGDDATQVELQDLINDSGFKNEALQLTDQELLQNIRALQAEANIHQSDKLVAPLGRCSLDIEMETGTGKTYVYIKTMFELNKRYGWSKFIVVVPSIAIREGVKKSFEITADHFMECYGKKARFFILNELNNSFSGRNEVVDRLCRYPLLIIDDFGMERGTEYALEQIYNIVDSRYRSRKPLIVTTNLTLDEIRHPQDTAHARIYDRLLEMCVPISCIGVSLRRETAQEKLERLKALIG